MSLSSKIRVAFLWNLFFQNCQLMHIKTASTPSLSDVENCFKDDLFPVFNNMSGTFDCYELTTQGPCNEDEFLVLKDDLSEAYCAKLPCQQSDFVLFEVN
jgi:hypothetical protein